MARVFRVKAVVISLLLTTVIAAAFRNPNYPVRNKITISIYHQSINQIEGHYLFRWKANLIQIR